ncbi:hypothetical protein HNR25_004395 [Streptomonospora salina]|uniref:LysR substrate-binding domain-containing protein n=1 Tax=Streptomonospora salina TaxID=104205 RepID=A0A841EE38_9ACTN|nr:hypothetical protein [Streptomonospora salina]MBB6000644.1 hypothetical protein [Streptomonospora salina]
MALVPRLLPVAADHPVVRVRLHGTPQPSRSILTAVRSGSGDHPAVALGLAALGEAAARDPADAPPAGDRPR